MFNMRSVFTRMPVAARTFQTIKNFPKNVSPNIDGKKIKINNTESMVVPQLQTIRLEQMETRCQFLKTRVKNLEDQLETHDHSPKSLQDVLNELTTTIKTLDKTLETRNTKLKSQPIIEIIFNSIVLVIIAMSCIFILFGIVILIECLSKFIR